MINARVTMKETEFSFKGSAAVISVETGFLMYQLIDTLRETGRSDDFIRAMFEVCMKHQDE